MKKARPGGTILITGGSGFIGANLARRLLKEGYDVHVLVRKSSNLWRVNDIKKDLSIHPIGLLDKNLNKLVRKISPVAIFHLATYSSYRNQEEVQQILDTSIQGTLNLLHASLETDYKIFVNTGSSSEYGFKLKPMKETDILEPISFYAIAKASQTLLCQAFSYQYRRPIVTVRPFSVYGPYEQSDRFIPTIFTRVIENNPIDLTPGNQRRDFIHINDVVDVYVKTIKEGKKLSGKILNIGTGKEYSNDEIVKIVFKITGKKVPVRKGGFKKRMWDSPHWVADIRLTKRSLNWTPQYSIEKGLLDTYNWLTKKTIYEQF